MYSVSWNPPAFGTWQARAGTGWPTSISCPVVTPEGYCSAHGCTHVAPKRNALGLVRRQVQIHACFATPEGTRLLQGIVEGTLTEDKARSVTISRKFGELTSSGRQPFHVLLKREIMTPLDAHKDCDTHGDSCQPRPPSSYLSYRQYDTRYVTYRFHPSARHMSPSINKKCTLTAQEPYARRFRNKHINMSIALLFEEVVRAADIAELPGGSPHLSLFDLHHGHVFYSYALDDIGTLFHASEYPYDFPYASLGYCQQGSMLPYSEERMSWRNFVWIRNTIACLNVSPDSPLEHTMLMSSRQADKTILESCLGLPICDVYHYPKEVMQNRRKQDRVFALPCATN